jgi:hypothetical protein
MGIIMEQPPNKQNEKKIEQRQNSDEIQGIDKIQEIRNRIELIKQQDWFMNALEEEEEEEEECGNDYYSDYSPQP